MDNVLSPDEQIDIDERLTANQFSKRMFNAPLAALRAQHPFVPIIPMPNEVKAYLLTANTAMDINIPSGAKMVRFNGDGDYWLTRNGQAQIPSAAVDTSTSAMLNPNDLFFYVEEIHQLSVIAATGVKLSMMVWSQLNG